MKKFKEYILGLRKLSVMLLILTVAIIFRLNDYIDGKDFTELIKVTATAFFASNLGKGIADAIKDKINRGK